VDLRARRRQAAMDALADAVEGKEHGEKGRVGIAMDAHARSVALAAADSVRASQFRVETLDAVQVQMLGLN